MASPADRFTSLQKVAIFLIAIGEEQTRRFLATLDLAAVERINGAIAGLGPIAADEKASVMIEFADFFYRDKPLSVPPADQTPPRRRPKAAPARRRPESSPDRASDPPEHTLTPPEPQKAEEDALLDTLNQLRQRVDPGKIDWGKAGYDFGEGFQGPTADRP